MLLGKVGNKSIAFINHKPFHPGNLQNLEKVWIAEQKAANEVKRQKEMLERRKHEVQIEELRKALREKERQQSAAMMNTITSNIALRTSSSSKNPETDVCNLMIDCQEIKRARCGNAESRKAKRQRKALENNLPKTVISKYKEDELEGEHSSVWGSYYDQKQNKWGYACCKKTIRQATCK